MMDTATYNHVDVLKREVLELERLEKDESVKADNLPLAISVLKSRIKMLESHGAEKMD